MQSYWLMKMQETNNVLADTTKTYTFKTGINEKCFAEQLVEMSQNKATTRYSFLA